MYVLVFLASVYVVKFFLVFFSWFVLYVVAGLCI